METTKNIFIVLVLLSAMGAALAEASPGLRVNRTELDFPRAFFYGKGQPNQTKGPKAVTVSAPANGPGVSGLAINVVGDASKDFQVSPSSTCPSNLTPGQSCKVLLTFTPTLDGSRRARLEVIDSAPRITQVKLSGLGYRAMKWRGIPANFFVGKAQVGRTVTKTLDVMNPNSVSIPLQSITTSGPFSQRNNCGSSLGPGQTCQIQVTFRPTVACPGTVETGLLSVANESAPTPQESKLSGVTVNNSEMAMFVANFASNTLTAYPITANGDRGPIESIGGGANHVTGVAVDRVGRIYVTTEFGNNTPLSIGSITVYAACANGQAAPFASIVGDRTGLLGPTSIVLDSHDNIYVSNLGEPNLQLAECSHSSITVYSGLGQRFGNLNEKPTATIAGDQTGLNCPSGLTRDRRGNLYVANLGAVTVYATDSKGNIPPIVTLAEPLPQSVALDSRQRIYVANFGAASEPSSIDIFEPLAKGLRQIASISGSNTILDRPNYISLDSRDNIYVSNDHFLKASGSINVYPALLNGSGPLNEAPLATISGPSTGLNAPKGIAFDSHGGIFVANTGLSQVDTGSITAYPPLAQSSMLPNEPPTAVIGATRTGLDQPHGVVVDLKGTIYGLNFFGGPQEEGTVTAYRPGSGAM